MPVCSPRWPCAGRTDGECPRTAPTVTDKYDFAVFSEPLTLILNLWDIFEQNGSQIRADFARITAGRTSAPITDPFTRCYAPENIFVEEGANIRAPILNAENGPIYIGRNATINEGSVVIGPFSLGHDSAISWNSKCGTTPPSGLTARWGAR